MEGEVNGFGGIFIKSKNPEAQGKWYSDHFGLVFQYGMHTFKWRQLNDASIQAKTAFTFFKEDTKYFQPSIKNQMLNFRVNNLRPLLETLKSAHVEVDPKIEDSEYGTFGWIMDPEGNRVELWSGNRN
ncbi:MAG: VOC family protein [Bacteroidetes bacterium]|nr:VOC family protein [Bacteroidota bacterium]